MGAASKSFHFDLVGLAVDGFIAVSGVSVISPSYHFGVDSFGRGGGGGRGWDLGWSTGSDDISRQPGLLQ